MTQATAVQVDPHLRPVLTAGVRRVMREYKHALSTMKKGSDADAVHAFRVASRRAIVAIDLLNATAGSPVLRKMRRTLRRGIATTSSLRDTHVMMDLLRDRLADAPLCREFYDVLLTKETRFRETLEARMRGGRFLDHKALKLVTAHLRGMQDVSAVLPAVEEMLDSLRSQLRVRGPAAVATFHRAREVIRDIRFAIELLSLPGDEAAQKQLMRVRDVQTLLGDVHDLDNLRIALLARSAHDKRIGANRRALAAHIAVEVRGTLARCKTEAQTIVDLKPIVTSFGSFGPAYARVYLLRHAIAEKTTTGTRDDRTRALTKRGRKRMKHIAEGIASLKLRPEIIFTSPLVRAFDTARILAGVLPESIPVRRCVWLSPMVSTETVVASLAPFVREGKSIIVVGHEPALQQLAGKLTGKGSAIVPLRKGGLCNITFATADIRRKGTLTWMLTPKQLAT